MKSMQNTNNIAYGCIFLSVLFTNFLPWAESKEM